MQYALSSAFIKMRPVTREAGRGVQGSPAHGVVGGRGAKPRAEAVFRAPFWGSMAHPIGGGPSSLPRVPRMPLEISRGSAIWLPQPHASPGSARSPGAVAGTRRSILLLLRSNERGFFPSEFNFTPETR